MRNLHCREIASSLFEEVKDSYHPVAKRMLLSELGLVTDEEE